ncbi:hypothetical protein M011DRAFT_523058 [Sporormia fimetaria CBS 119925]|uniref:Uncharacterized protein n=1 Tax=Sporormia fimetaria CBS 119925 TaxID=1340428 RepID=A0A6A6VSH9_9PLEO|nr:hypothetical protein M011DRAFT_523058 [Sporormia fimetaria CBS 119925]
MKIAHPLIALAGAATAAALDQGTYTSNSTSAVTTTTFYTTPVLTVTACSPGVMTCSPPATAVVTSIVAITTTVCPTTTSIGSQVVPPIPSTNSTAIGSVITTPLVNPVQSTTSQAVPSVSSIPVVTSIQSPSIFINSSTVSVFSTSSAHNISTSTQAYTSSETPARPSGPSAVPLPSGNVTWTPPVAPVPTNGASRISSKASTVAMVVALAVTFDSRWLTALFLLGNVEASEDSSLQQGRDIKNLEDRIDKLSEVVSNLNKTLTSNKQPHSLRISRWVINGVFWFLQAMTILSCIQFWRWCYSQATYPPHDPRLSQAVVQMLPTREDEAEEIWLYAEINAEQDKAWESGKHSMYEQE